MRLSTQILIPLLAAVLSGCTTTPKEEQAQAPQMTLEERIQELESQVHFLQFEVSSWREAMSRQGFYVVKAGDTGAKIANAFGLTLDALMILNPDIEWRRLKIGMVIRVKQMEPANQPLQGTPGKVPSSSTEPETRRP